MSSNAPVIQVENVSKCFRMYDRSLHRLQQLLVPAARALAGPEVKDRYREFWALRDVSFEVYPGQTVGVIGQNGSGKSTLLQIITGTMEPTLGTVRTAGKTAALLELGSGFNPDFTGRENVYLNGHLLGLSRAEIDAKFDYIAAFAEVGAHLDMPVKTYSSGMMLRLAFAVQVAVETQVLIIDEALAVGDARFQRKCFKRLEELKAAGTTILFVSHATELVRSFCDFGLVLDKGNPIYWGDARSATVRYMATVFPDHTKPTDAPTVDSGCAKIEYVQDPDGGLVVKPDQSELHSFGVGGALVNWLKIYGLAAPNVVIDRQQVRVRLSFSWSHDVVQGLVEQEGYVKDITPSIALSDKQGNYIFGANGFDSGLFIDCLSAESRIVEFSFIFPMLKPGEYFLTVAIALGTQLQHVQLKWYDALLPIRFIASSRNTYGVMRLDYDLKLIS